MKNKALITNSFHMQIILLLICGILPNMAGFINLPTIWGFKIHFFQVFIFIAAAATGSAGGLLAGGMGSIFSSIVMNNPYIIFGNMILGTVTGFLVKCGWPLPLAVLAGFLVQIPWLVITDVYLIGMPLFIVKKLLLSLLISNLLWSVTAMVGIKYLKANKLWTK
ncbi:hypothetical protein ACFL4D_00150 [Candidatus Margulisiibacteriota bacterium]